MVHRTANTVQPALPLLLLQARALSSMPCSQWSTTRSVGTIVISGQGPTARLSDVVDADCFGPHLGIGGTCTLLIYRMLALYIKSVHAYRLHTRLHIITDLMTFTGFSHSVLHMLHITILIGRGRKVFTNNRHISRSRFVVFCTQTKYDQMEIS